MTERDTGGQRLRRRAAGLQGQPHMRMPQLVAEIADPDDGRHALQAARVLEPAQLVEQAGAAALAHGDVADQHVVGLARQGRQRLGAAAHARDATAAQRQEHILQIGALDRMILDQEDAAGGAGFGLGHRALSWSLRI